MKTGTTSRSCKFVFVISMLLTLILLPVNAQAKEHGSIDAPLTEAEARAEILKDVQNRDETVTVWMILTEDQYCYEYAKKLLGDSLALMGDEEYEDTIVSLHQVGYGYGSSDQKVGYLDGGELAAWAPIEYDLGWYESASEEAWAWRQIRARVKALGLFGSDHNKVRKIYDWVVDNVSYDYDAAKDSERNLKAFTSYGALKAGKATCQGIAILFARLCRAAGIPCHYVSGRANGSPHAWNYVKVSGNWYFADATWDICRTKEQGYSDYAYFLLGGSAEHTILFKDEMSLRCPNRNLAGDGVILSGADYPARASVQISTKKATATIRVRKFSYLKANTGKFVSSSKKGLNISRKKERFQIQVKNGKCIIKSTKTGKYLRKKGKSLKWGAKAVWNVKKTGKKYVISKSGYALTFQKGKIVLKKNKNSRSQRFTLA